MLSVFFLFFFFNDTATTEIYTLSLHDALPILVSVRVVVQGDPRLALGAAAVRQHSSRPDAAGRCTAARASRVTAHLRRRPPNLAVAHGAGSAASSAGGLAAGAAGAVCGTTFRKRRWERSQAAGVGRGLGLAVLAACSRTSRGRRWSSFAPTRRAPTLSLFHRDAEVPA